MTHLLIVDDEAVIRQGLLSMPWKEIGVHVTAAVDNGLEAMEVLQGELVDIVLTDIRMPGLDGLELAQMIHEQELGVEIILLSGYSDFEYARSAIQYGVTEYILKPSNPEEIIDAVKRATESVKKRRDADRRLRLLESELGKRQLVQSQDGIVLGEYENSSIAQQILDYIANGYAKPISLASMSAELHFSTIYLSKVVKKATGYTFLEIVNAMRVNNAAMRIREDRRTLSEICDAVGIKDPRYFSQVFKKYYGTTPSRYKKLPCVPIDAKLAYLVQGMREGRP